MRAIPTPSLARERLRYGATSYRIYTGSEPGVTEDNEVLASLSGTTYLHANADPQRTHYYRASAVNQWSEGPLSNEAVVTPLLPVVPDRPTHVAATPGDQQVVLTWNPVDNVEGYRLYWGVAANAYGDPIEVQLPYVHDDLGNETHDPLNNGTRYYYRVSGYNARGEGPKSIEVSATPQSPAQDGAPQNVTAIPGDSMVTLTWDPVGGAASYRLHWHDTDNPFDRVIDGAESPYDHVELTNGTTYYYRVRAVTNSVEGPPSLEVSAKPEPLVKAPIGLYAEAGSAQVKLSWESVDDAGSYELFWDTEVGVAATDNSILGIADTKFTHAGVSNGTTYSYRIRARAGGATSGLSAEVSAMPQYELDTQQKLTATNAEAGDQFGFSVAISGDYLVVGAPRPTSPAATAGGAAYVFHFNCEVNQWQEVSKLTASDAEGSDEFGSAVAIDGDFLVVGASDNDDSARAAGAAYVFERSGAGSGWTQVAKLAASDAGAGDEFGYSVAISGDYLVVGARFDENEGGSLAGAAYLFQRSDTGADWTQVTKLVADDAGAGDGFGWSVAIGDHLVVGAPYQGETHAGAVYVFERSDAGDWEQVRKVTAMDANAGDAFGWSLAISGEYMVVGACEDDEGGSDAGAAYVFKQPATGTYWAQVAKLAGADAGSQFGSSAAISGEYILVGAAFQGDTGAGAAHLFERSDLGEWDQVREVTASDAGTLDHFGSSVAISGRNVVVGASGEDSQGNDAGACYVF